MTKKPIEMGKEYRTRDGRKVRLLCVDRKADQPVVAILVNAIGTENVETFSSTGGYHLIDADSKFNLVEYKPWSEVPKYTPAWVRDSENNRWAISMFMEFRIQDGRPLFTANGGHAVTWEFVTLENPYLGATK